MPLRITDAATKSVVAEATVPLEITEALLLLVPLDPAPAAGLRYQTYVLDDSAVRQAAGTLSILNLSGFALSGTVGDRATSLATGLNPAVPIARSAAVVLRTTVKNRSLRLTPAPSNCGGANARCWSFAAVLPGFGRGAVPPFDRQSG